MHGQAKGIEEGVNTGSLGVPVVDISEEFERHVVVAAGTPDVYQGHPTTLLMPDGRTMFAVWTYGHGGACGPLKVSEDGGLTWSGLLPVPENWSTVENCPALYYLTDPDGVSRLFVFAMRKAENGALYQSYSEDGGRTWTPYAPNGVQGIVMPWCSVIPLGDGRYLAQTNARRVGDPDPISNNIVQSISNDGGLTWERTRVVLDMPGYKPSEPALLYTPDQRRILSVMRENSRRLHSLVMSSEDQGATWSDPQELPAALTGDRHVFRYDTGGRLVCVFRDRAEGSPTKNHFVAWVGTITDVLERRPGQYRVKLLHSHAGPDCGYPGLELLHDGTFVATTYIKYAPGPNKHSVVSVRFRLDEIEARTARGAS